MTIYVIGHSNPDTDSIVSAIAVAELLTQRGLEVVACANGEPTPESKFVLEKFNLATPSIITNVEGKDLALVDTSDVSQLPDGLEKANIVFIADHHQLGGIKTSAPVEMYVQPVGCTATVLLNIFNCENKKIPANIAGAMMCAILSDTVLFKSPTTTEFDKLAVGELAKIAGIEKPLELGLEMLKVKSSIENDTSIELINRDLKHFSIKEKPFAVGQIELVDGAMINSKKAEIISDMKKIKEEKGHHTMLLLVTDIMKEGSEVIIISDDLPAIEKAFEIKCDENHCVWIEGMMSRKKQVIPILETKF